ncbi:spore germination protein [Rossellomorea marisflavi]|uniref:spore germination protein n=1 Tax=Rossellomorea marisflavi TaxID=189381 RepID=UPI003D2EE08C
MSTLEIQKYLKANIERIKNTFHQTSDLIVRNIKAGFEGNFDICIIHLDGLIDTETVQNHVVKPLLQPLNTEVLKESLINQIVESTIESADVKVTSQYQDIINAIVKGNTIILINGYDKAIIVPSVSWKERSIEQTTGERSPRGPVIGLTEKLKTNINIIRYTIQTPDLCVETIELGTDAKKAVSILYIEGIVDRGILKEVKGRIKKLNIKYLPNARVVSDALEGKPPSVFPLIRESDRIDAIESSLFEGRVAIIVDGIPEAIIAPSLFIESLQAPDEYHIKYGRLTIRFIRFISFLMGIFLPAIYLAIANFHKENFSPKNVKLFITNDEVIPTFWELFILSIIIRMLIDASFRLPKSAVILVSLIGTIIIGQTAITAHIIHPVSLIVVGLSALSSFLVINQGFAAVDNILRILLLLIANFLGFEGIIVASTLLILYMVNLNSLGVPYLSPLIPFRIQELKDTLYRGDLKKLINSKHTFNEND